MLVKLPIAKFCPCFFSCSTVVLIANPVFVNVLLWGASVAGTAAAKDFKGLLIGEYVGVLLHIHHGYSRALFLGPLRSFSGYVISLPQRCIRLGLLFSPSIHHLDRHGEPYKLRTPSSLLTLLL